MPRDPLSLIGIQTDLVWNDPEANRHNIGQQLGALDMPPNALVVLPEMFTTGFVSEPPTDRQEEGKSRAWMRHWSKELNATLAGSIACLDENNLGRNRFLLVNAQKDTVHYDKRHLFSFAGEDQRFTSGQDRVECQIQDARVLLQVCYDLRFPVFFKKSRNNALRLGHLRRQLARREGACLAHTAHRTGHRKPVLGDGRQSRWHRRHRYRIQRRQPDCGPKRTRCIGWARRSCTRASGASSAARIGRVQDGIPRSQRR